MICSLEDERDAKGVNYIMIRPDKRILIQKRCSKANTFPDRYCFPGGAKDMGESDHKAAVREIKEETGKHVYQLEPFVKFEYILYGGIRVNIFFLCFVDYIKIVPTEGEMIWMTLAEINKLDLVLGENELLPLLIRRLVDI